MHELWGQFMSSRKRQTSQLEAAILFFEYLSETERNPIKREIYRQLLDQSRADLNRRQPARKGAA
jgi:hypothetical protein